MVLNTARKPIPTTAVASVASAMVNPAALRVGLGELEPFVARLSLQARSRRKTCGRKEGKLMHTINEHCLCPLASAAGARRNRKGAFPKCKNQRRIGFTYGLESIS